MQKIFSFFILQYAQTQFAYSQTPGMKGNPSDSMYKGKRINAIASRASSIDVLKVHIKNIMAVVKGMKSTIIELRETFNNHFKPEEVQEELFTNW